MNNVIISEAFDNINADMEGFGTIQPSGGWQTMTKFGIDGMFNYLDRFYYIGLGKTTVTLVKPQFGLAGTATHYFWAGSNQPGIGCQVGIFNTTWYSNRVTGH